MFEEFILKTLLLFKNSNDPCLDLKLFSLTPGQIFSKGCKFIHQCRPNLQVFCVVLKIVMCMSMCKITRKSTGALGLADNFKNCMNILFKLIIDMGILRKPQNL